ncbi:MAG: aminoacyl-histidine dipeptidase [Alistipes sp.]|nr:aminoacyl-histidine dipeptidase [Alistipes sp.]
MNYNLESLNPALVWKHFKAMTQIPRPSHHEEKIREYIVEFAKAHNLEYTVDEACNVYIAKPATAGYEDRKGIVMQAHLDMVPQKNNDKVFDFENDPIEAYIDGEWVTANGTTLGADNGIGAAAILAVLEDDSLEHGAIEGLFTATEETGMDGAFGLKAGLLKGDILLNLDSETEGELYVGCAGGTDANITLPYTAEAAPEGWSAVKLEVKGLKGGHSGIQIGFQRGNANRLLCRLLLHTEQEWLLSSVDGGGLRNAIPREAQAVVLVKAVVGAPNGVVKMSVEMEGLVQTSTNLARVVSNGECVKIQCLLRSSVSSEKLALAEAIKGVFEMAGAEVELSGSYDGWKPNMESPILKAMLASYEALYGKRPAVTAIHAGLECGIIGGVYPNLDMISFGPTICYPHSPDEKVEIASVAKFYEFLLHTLKNAPAK